MSMLHCTVFVHKEAVRSRMYRAVKEKTFIIICSMLPFYGLRQTKFNLRILAAVHMSALALHPDSNSFECGFIASALKWFYAIWIQSEFNLD